MRGESKVEVVECKEDAEVEWPCLGWVGRVGRVVRVKCEELG